MPRTLDATLEAALDAQTFTKPIIRGWIGTDGSKDHALTVLKYELGRTYLSISVHNPNLYDIGQSSTYNTIILERGLEIASTEYTIDTAFFYIDTTTLQNGLTSIKASLFNNQYLSVAGDNDYETVITDALAPISHAPKFQNASANWLAYQFMPVGKQLLTNRNSNIQSLLHQKYFIFFTEDQQVSTDILVFSTDDVFARSTDWTIQCNARDKFVDEYDARSYRWIDENGTYNTLGSATLPIHNLGYLESTCNPPDANPLSLSKPPLKYGYAETTIPFHLKYQSGDRISFSQNSKTYECVLEVIERLDPSAEITWSLTLKPLDYLTNTEGGALPSTIERVSNYTPLNTSNFDGALSENDNNLQAAMDTLDDHTHAYTALTGRPTAETNTNDVYALSSPGGVSAFTGTINGTPSGASVAYNVTSGQEGAMVPTSTSQLAKLRLYNTTRSNSALISNCNTTTNTITLTANAPANWASGDTITIVSQTVSGGSIDWIDLEFTSGLTGKSSVFMTFYPSATSTPTFLYVHPFETYGISKRTLISMNTTGTISGQYLIKIVSNVFSIGWTANLGGLTIREAGYLE